MVAEMQHLDDHRARDLVARPGKRRDLVGDGFELPANAASQEMVEERACQALLGQRAKDRRQQREILQSAPSRTTAKDTIDGTGCRLESS